VVPLEKTGTVLEPPPATVVLNVVTDESDTKVLAPAVAVTALGKSATLYTFVERLSTVTKEFKLLLVWLKYKRKTLFS
jgi:hypothetical protein